MVRPDYSSDAYENFRMVWEGRKRSLEEIYGDEARARVIELMLEELEEARVEELIEDVALQDAPKVTGFSIDTIRRAIQSGELRNVADDGATRVRAAELPFRPGRAHPGALRRRLYGCNGDPEEPTADDTAARLEPVEE